MYWCGSFERIVLCDCNNLSHSEFLSEGRGFSPGFGVFHVNYCVVVIVIIFYFISL